MDMNDIKALIEALRSGGGAQESMTIHSGPNPRTIVKDPAPKGLFPIEGRREGYRMYLREAKVNGESPISYQEWLATQTPTNRE